MHRPLDPEQPRRLSSTPVAAPATVHPVPPGQTQWTVIAGIPGAWRVIRNRVAVLATSRDGIAVDGQLVDGLQLLRSDIDGHPSRITAGARRLEILDREPAPLLRVLPVALD